MSAPSISGKESVRKTAVVLGILFIIATAFLFIGDAFYGPVLDTPGYLEIAHPHRVNATIGILMEFTCVLAIPLIAVFAFPVLKRFSEPLALGYVAFRFFEAVLFIIVDINKLSLINISQGHIAGRGIDSAFYPNLGGFIQAWNVWGWSFYILVFGVGAVILYTVLYRSKLVPRWISVWGEVAAVLIISSAPLSMFAVHLDSPDGLFEVVLVVPIAVQEMVLAAWLIIRGFSPTAAPDSGNPTGVDRET